VKVGTGPLFVARIASGPVAERQLGMLNALLNDEERMLLFGNSGTTTMEFRAIGEARIMSSGK
jgi:hypothetical protein